MAWTTMVISRTKIAIEMMVLKKRRTTKATATNQRTTQKWTTISQSKIKKGLRVMQTSPRITRPPKPTKRNEMFVPMTSITLIKSLIHTLKIKAKIQITMMVGREMRNELEKTKMWTLRTMISEVTNKWVLTHGEQEMRLEMSNRTSTRITKTIRTMMTRVTGTTNEMTRETKATKELPVQAMVQGEATPSNVSNLEIIDKPTRGTTLIDETPIQTPSNRFGLDSSIGK